MLHLVGLTPRLGLGRPHEPRHALGRDAAHHEPLRTVDDIRDSARQRLLGFVVADLPFLLRDPHDEIGRRLVELPGADLRREQGRREQLVRPQVFGAPADRAASSLDDAVHVAGHVGELLRADRHVVRQDVHGHDRVLGKTVADRHHPGALVERDGHVRHGRRGVERAGGNRRSQKCR